MSDWYPTPAEIQTAWTHFPGSPIQYAIHQYLEDRLKSGRSSLESCAPTELQRLQAQVAEIKGLRAFIHSKDTPQVKKLYAEQH